LAAALSYLHAFLAETKRYIQQNGYIWMVDLIGRKIGNYFLLRLLGKGSVAQVYLGEHVFLQTQAAIKVFNSTLTPAQLEVFRREAGQSVRLEHPHLVRVLESGDQNNLPFLVMQYAPKGTLRHRHPPDRPLAPETILPYVQQITAALQYLHKRHLVHRGVKPENLLIGRRQEILLSDFGLLEIARHAPDQSLLDQSEARVYLAPEYVQGQAEPASDQYALGVVIYEWLSGERLLAGGASGEKLIQSGGLALLPLSRKVPTISPEMEWVVHQALASEPKQRFATIQAFATAFEHASKASQKNKPALFARPIPQIYLESTLISPPNAPGSAAALGAPTQPDPTLPTLPAPTGKRRFSRRYFLLALAGIAAVGVGATGLALASHLQGHGNTGQQTATPTTLGKLLLTYKKHTYPVLAAAWSSDSKRIVSAGDGGEVLIWDATTGSTILPYAGYADGTDVFVITWSPDGNSIASGGRDAAVQVWKSATGSLLSTFRDGTPDTNDNGNDIESVAWSPDGQWLAVANGTEAVAVLDTASWSLTHTYHQSDASVNVEVVAWSPDSSRIALGTDGKTVEVRKALTDDQLVVFSGHTDVVRTVTWSPDGKLIASGSADKTVQVWDAATGQPLHRYSDPFHDIHRAIWSPDSKRIAIASGNLVVLWNPVEGTAGKVVYTYQGHTADVYALAWSLDGTRIASGGADTTVQVWSAV
jgi:serine/threonine protein kinase/Tol biopolymer transport system component